MNRKRKNEIEELAKQVLIESNLYRAEVDVNALAESKGISVVEHNFESNISGVFWTNGVESIIGYNKNNGEKRRRFTIAHELGHYFLGHERKEVFIDSPSKYYSMLFRDEDSSTGEYTQEKEANAFAAALLMPKELVMAKIHELYQGFYARANNSDDGENTNLIGDLSSHFNVSQQAMTLRLTNLDMSW